MPFGMWHSVFHSEPTLWWALPASQSEGKVTAVFSSRLICSHLLSPLTRLLLRAVTFESWPGIHRPSGRIRKTSTCSSGTWYSTLNSPVRASSAQRSTSPALAAGGGLLLLPLPTWILPSKARRLHG